MLLEVTEVDAVADRDTLVLSDQERDKESETEFVCDTLCDAVDELLNDADEDPELETEILVDTLSVAVGLADADGLPDAVDEAEELVDKELDVEIDALLVRDEEPLAENDVEPEWLALSVIDELTESLRLLVSEVEIDVVNDADCVDDRETDEEVDDDHDTD